MDAASLEVALLVGLQGSGKTTFYRRHLAATHEHVSRDLFRNHPRPRARQLKLLEDALARGRCVALDNTNPSRADRAAAIAAARGRGARVVVYFFPPDVKASIARNARREGKERVPVVGILATRRRLEPPAFDEGIDRVFEVRPLPEGSFDVAERPR